jgi:dTDP-4-dehydrorhamnose 3,5-epimerase
MKVLDTSLEGVLLVEPRVHRDTRGFFLETWRRDAYAEALGLSGTFVQDNASYSMRGVLRGLHYQHPSAQGKLIGVLSGAVWDVAVDIRRGSPTFGRWVGQTLSAENGRQIYIPAGFAHGFVVTSPSALVAYKCTAYHDGTAEGTICWDDPDLAIAWPVDEPVLSDKDGRAPRLRDMAKDRLPVMAQ